MSQWEGWGTGMALHAETFAIPTVVAARRLSG